MTPRRPDWPSWLIMGGLALACVWLFVYVVSAR